MREGIITQMTRKTNFFEVCSWFKFINFKLVLVMTLKINSSVGKGLKPKVRKCCRKLAGSRFALSSTPILNRVESELTDLVLKEKYRFHCFNDCSVKVTCIVTAIILENMFGNIKSAVFIYRGIGECAVELA